MPKKPNTKGKHIQHRDVLPRGDACLSCKARKVRCSGGIPACVACLRSANFVRRDLSTVFCDYSQKKFKRRGSSKKSGASASSLGYSPVVEDNFQIEFEQSEDLFAKFEYTLPNISFGVSNSNHFPSTFDANSESYFSDSSSSWTSSSNLTPTSCSPTRFAYALPPPEPANYVPPPNSPFSQNYLETTMATPVSHYPTQFAIPQPPVSPNPFETSFSQAMQSCSLLELTPEAFYGQGSCEGVEGTEGCWQIMQEQMPAF